MSSLRDQLQPTIDHAIKLHQSGRVAEAEQMYRQVLQQDPDNPDALHLLGLVAQHAGQLAPAMQLMLAAIASAPQIPLYHMNLAKVYRWANRLDEATASAKRAIELAPRFAEAHVELAACLNAQGNPAAARDAANRALRLRADSPEARGALANALADEGRTDEAIAQYRRILRTNPRHAETLNNLGEALRKLGQFDEAERLLRDAVKYSPDVGNPHFNLSLILLARGDFEHGWPEYEWRWKQIGVHPPTFTQPQWDGGDLNGQSILLFAEQGLGDTIQFIRYAPQVRDRGASRVIVQCEATLAPLIKTVEGVTDVIAKDEPRPAFDVRCAIASLPYRFKTTLAAIPNDVPYVKFDPARAARWRDELKLSRDVLNVGFVWAGSAIHKNDRNRSCQLSDFTPLAGVAGARFISLQLGPAAQQLQTPPPAMRIDDATPHIHDFTDTAALMSELDLIISVDTSPAHLAGALARPVWTIHPIVADFRWLLDRDDSPWYPTMRIFRQLRPGDWKNVMLQVADELKKRVAT